MYLGIYLGSKLGRFEDAVVERSRSTEERPWQIFLRKFDFSKPQLVHIFYFCRFKTAATDDCAGQHARACRSYRYGTQHRVTVTMVSWPRLYSPSRMMNIYNPTPRPFRRGLCGTNIISRITLTVFTLFPLLHKALKRKQLTGSKISSITSYYASAARHVIQKVRVQRHPSSAQFCDDPSTRIGIPQT